MVTDYIEDGSDGGDCWWSSDSDSVGFSKFHLLAEKISFLKLSNDQYESDLQSVVQSLLLSIRDKNLQHVKSGMCNGSCIRYALVKLLKLVGYDAGVCASKWPRCNMVPGGDHEYIDITNYNSNPTPERIIVDIDFRSHFEIAKPVESYDKILKSLPVTLVGSLTKLKQFLQVMADATEISLKQNSMPLPPWRSLAYLQAKWASPFQRNTTPVEKSICYSITTDHHKQCISHLKRLQSSIQSVVEKERVLKPVNIDTSKRLKSKKKMNSSSFTNF